MIREAYLLQKKIESTFSPIVGKVSFRLIRAYLRIVSPLRYKINKNSELAIGNNFEENIILSFTSFPDRIKSIPVVIDTLFRQTVKPDRIILWLAKDQFQDEDELNNFFLPYKKKGLEIMFCDDLKSHKKYLNCMKQFKESIIITVDDDIFYPEDLIENLYNKYKENPDMVTCMRAHMICFDNDEVLPYQKWNHRSKGTLGPSDFLFFTTGGGTLFPAGFYDPKYLNAEIIKSKCFYADDVWLNFTRIAMGKKVVKVFDSYPEPFSTKGSDENGLAKDNVVNELNDKQIKSVLKYLKEKVNYE